MFGDFILFIAKRGERRRVRDEREERGEGGEREEGGERRESGAAAGVMGSYG